MSFSTTLGPLVRKLAGRCELDADDKQAVLDLPHHQKRIDRHGYVVREREKTTQSCLMLSGYAIRHKIVVSGERQIVAMHMKGDMVDLQNSFLTVADHNVQMLTDSEVAFIPREAVKKLAFERPRVGMAMWFDTLVDGSIFREWIANVGRRDARTRIAHLLCEFSFRLEEAGLCEGTAYELPMTQEQIADCTGLTSVHVNRMMKLLDEEGVIERRQGRTVVIADRNRLAHSGDFDPTYLHFAQRESAFG